MNVRWVHREMLRKRMMKSPKKTTIQRQFILKKNFRLIFIFLGRRKECGAQGTVRSFWSSFSCFRRTLHEKWLYGQRYGIRNRP